MSPIAGNVECWAPLVKGHATAEPATALMKSRLRTQPSTRGRATSFFQSLAEWEDAVRGTHVRFGSLPKITVGPRDIRVTPESGHVRCTSPCPLSANSGH